MLNALVSAARQVWGDWRRVWQRGAVEPAAVEDWTDTQPVPYEPLEQVVLTDGVCRTLFEEYAEHRESKRGDEETGWVLMGLRHEREAIALATLPAGAGREAGVAHVRFNSDAQALASRIVRQEDRQLAIVGVVHTHPGSLRHPSNGDYQGDITWVGQLRGSEGIFGIGTADGDGDSAHPLFAHQPKRHSQCYLGLRFSWYALAAGDRNYRTLPVQVTIGPDLARPLHQVWPTIEWHADRLNRLYTRLARMRFEVVEEEKDATLHAVVPLEKGDSLRVILRGSDVEYCLVRKDQWLVSDSREPAVDRGVYLMLAELAQEKR